MEKEPQPDSLTDVTVKQYAASDVYSSEPPPAYHRPQSTAVHVARIAAITVVTVSIVLGGFILAAAYVQANASCQQLQQELQLLQEEQRLQAAYQQQQQQLPLQPEALIQEEAAAKSQNEEHHHNKVKETDSNSITQDSSSERDESSSSSSSDNDHDDDEEEEEENADRFPIHIKLPLQLDLDDVAEALIMERNHQQQPSRINCVVEKKRAEQLIDHQSKTVRLPFGLNLTTDPRFERVTGERIAIVCDGGDEQRPQQQQQPQQEEETMMIQPIVVPFPGPMSLPLHFNGQQQQQPSPLQHIHPHIMGQMPQEMRPMQRPMEAHIIMEQIPQRIPVPVPVPMQQHSMQQEQQQQQQRQRQEQQNQIQQEIQNPLPLMQHIAQQIIAQHEMAAAVAAQRQQQEQQQHQQQQQQQDSQEKLAEHIMTHRLPVPEEILTQINRLPNQDVIVSVSEQEAEEVAPEDIQVVQHQRASAQGMNGRQSYARGLPVHIPVPMMQAIAQQEQEQQQQQQLQEARPHYVQPRSVRSVDNALHREKRVKRCSCDCAC